MNIRASLITLIVGIFIMPSLVFAYTSPGSPTGYVNDFAHVLSTEVVQSLNSKLLAISKSSKVQISVVTVSSLGDESIETYAVKLFQEWGIGEKGKDNGLLILVAPNDHVARIEVGYGLEGTVTDLQAGGIVRNVMIPAFKSGDFDSGVTGAVDAVTGIISGSVDGTQFEDTSTGSSSSPSTSPFALIFFGLFVLNLLYRLLGRTKSWWLGGVIGAFAGLVIGYFAGFFPIGIIAIVVLTVLGLVFDYFASKRPPGSGSGPGGGIGFMPIFFGGSGGFGSGSSGGGFGGFGGGMSGGGGASGRW